MKKVAAFFLACLMSGACLFSSCGDNSAKDVKTDTGETPVSAAETEAPRVYPDLGGRDIRFLLCQSDDQNSYTLFQEEMTGDVVNDAIVRVNGSVMEKTNCGFVYTRLNTIEISAITKSVQSGSDEYDITIGRQWKMAPIVLKNVFLNVAGSENLDPDNPWWYDSYMKEVTVDGSRVYLLAGDIGVDTLRCCSCLIMDLDLYRRYHSDTELNAFYDTVLGGGWTLDLFGAMTGEYYADLNGNSEADDDDQYGFATATGCITDHFTINSGIRFTERDEKGIPYLVFNNEKTVILVEKMYSLLHENTGTRYREGLDVYKKLSGSETLFTFQFIRWLETLREIETDFSVLPFPKLDESVASYSALPHDEALVYAVPTTCPDIEPFCAVMELLGEYGRESVFPAYYETNVKVKYLRDESDAAAQLIDIIHDHITTDIAYVYTYALADIGVSLRAVALQKNKDFVSNYTKKEQNYQDKLAALTEMMTVGA